MQKKKFSLTVTDIPLFQIAICDIKFKLLTYGHYAKGFAKSTKDFVTQVAYKAVQFFLNKE